MPSTVVNESVTIGKALSTGAPLVAVMRHQLRPDPAALVGTAGTNRMTLDPASLLAFSRKVVNVPWVPALVSYVVRVTTL